MCPFLHSFLSQFARAFFARYQSSIFRCKKISELGAQQLLLDAQAIRSGLLNAPIFKPEKLNVDDDEVEAPTVDSSLTAPAIYIKYIQREMPRVELLLKIVASPKDRFADT